MSRHEHILCCIYPYVAAHWRSAGIPCLRQTFTISTCFLFNCIFHLCLLTKKASGHNLAEFLSFCLHPYLRKFATKERLYRTDSSSSVSLEIAICSHRLVGPLIHPCLSASVIHYYGVVNSTKGRWSQCFLGSVVLDSIYFCCWRPRIILPFFYQVVAFQTQASATVARSFHSFKLFEPVHASHCPGLTVGTRPLLQAGGSMTSVVLLPPLHFCNPSP